MDQVVQTPEVPILAVALGPGQPVAERLVVGQGHCLAEVNHPDPGQASVVMHEEEGAAHHLQGKRSEVSRRTGIGSGPLPNRQLSRGLDSMNSGAGLSGFKSRLCLFTLSHAGVQTQVPAGSRMGQERPTPPPVEEALSPRGLLLVLMLRAPLP